MRGSSAPPVHDDGEALRLAASLEQGSEHPLASAIVTAARERGLTLAPVTDFASEPGRGVRGRVESRRLALGTAAFLVASGIDVSAFDALADAERARARSVVLLAVDGSLRGARLGRRSRQAGSAPKRSARCAPRASRS